MFADPSVVAVGGGNHNFARTGITPNVGTFSYVDGDGNMNRLIIKQNTTKKRVRMEIRRTLDLSFTDPISGITSPQSASVYLVVDKPSAGIPDGALNDMFAGLAGFLTASSNAKYLQLLGGEY
jgi:hypothetical protein